MSKSRLEEIAKKVCARCSPWERDALIRMGRAVIAEAESSIDAEPELPGEMPYEMWIVMRDDRDAVAEALRIIVRQTKAGIRERLRSLDVPKEG